MTTSTEAVQKWRRQIAHQSGMKREIKIISNSE